MFIFIILILMLRSRFFNIFPNGYLLVLLLLPCISNTEVCYSNFNVSQRRNYSVNRNSHADNLNIEPVFYSYSTSANNYSSLNNNYDTNNNYNNFKKYKSSSNTNNSSFLKENNTINTYKKKPNINRSYYKAPDIVPNKNKPQVTHHPINPKSEFPSNTYNKPIFTSYDECTVSKISPDKKIAKATLRSRRFFSAMQEVLKAK